MKKNILFNDVINNGFHSTFGRVTLKTLNRKINKLELYQITSNIELSENEEMLDELNQLDSKFYEYKDPLTTLKLAFFDRNQDRVWSVLNSE